MQTATSTSLSPSLLPIVAALHARDMHVVIVPWKPLLIIEHVWRSRRSGVERLFSDAVLVAGRVQVGYVKRNLERLAGAEQVLTLLGFRSVASY